jgi:hypothetical protein
VNSLKEQMNNLNGLFFAGGGTDLIYDPNKKTNKQEKEKEKDEKNSETTNNYLDPNVEFVIFLSIGIYLISENCSCTDQVCYRIK